MLEKEKKSLRAKCGEYSARTSSSKHGCVKFYLNEQTEFERSLDLHQSEM